MQNLTFNAQNEVIDATEKGKNDLKILAQNYQFSESFILENADFLDWNIISENQKLTIEILVKCAKKIKWAKVSNNSKLNNDEKIFTQYKGDFDLLVKKENNREHFLRIYAHLFEWFYLDTRLVSNDFLAEFSDKIEWKSVFLWDRKDENFVRNNLSKIQNDSRTWSYISMEQSISEQFLRDFEDKIHFNCVASKMDKVVLSDAFVEDFKYILAKNNILKTQKNNLSKTFLQEYKIFDIDYFYQNITEEWIKLQPAHRLDWGLISKLTPLSEDFIFDFFEKLNFLKITKKQRFSEDFIRKITPKITNYYDWEGIFRYFPYSETFIEEYEKQYPFMQLYYLREVIAPLSESFIEKYKDKWNWKGLMTAKKFSHDFLVKHNEKWDWYDLIQYQTLSENFIRQFQDKINWERVSKYQILSENFMQEFEDKIYWHIISHSQILSEKFMQKFEEKLDWKALFRKQKMSENFIQEFKHKL